MRCQGYFFKIALGTRLPFLSILIWSVKYLNFGQKLLIRTDHDTFLESRHRTVTKNPYYVLSLEGSQKKRYQLGLIRYIEVIVIADLSFSVIEPFPEPSSES